MQMTWDQTVQGWDSQAREAVEMTVQRYGPPDEMGERRLTWYERGHWQHISVYRDGGGGLRRTGHSAAVPTLTPRELLGLLTAWPP
jgi:hypothetical protein